MLDLNTLNYKMQRIRMIEEEIAKRYSEQQMRCPVHLSIGQEAPAVGVCAALSPNDKMVSTHRGHAHYLAKGGSLNGLIGELYGRVTGCSRGNGGSMHLVDHNSNFWGSTSIVSGTVPVGVGLAFADRLKKDISTTIICIGDAAVEEGVFHEAANFASLHHLNIIFVCENNAYSCYTHIKHRQPKRPLKFIAKAHALHYLKSKPDVQSIIETTWKAKLLALEQGPVFLEIPTYRYLEHCGPNNDDHLNYRNSEETNYWKNKDPLKDVIKFQEITDEIDLAFKTAIASPYPDESEVGKYVYASN